MRVAVIGAGAVGASAAYYLSRAKDVELTVFDEGLGQATKAAAGIISPWFSKRRNKAWYRLARLGADFYPQLLSDLEEDGISSNFYQRTGVFVLKKDEEKLEELYQLALTRRKESPLIGQLAILDETEAKVRFPDLEGFSKLLYATGGARVDGHLLTETLLKAAGAQVVAKKVTLTPVDDGYLVDGQHFDKVILATGAWLAECLEPLGYTVDIRPQKGQLRDYYFEDRDTQDYPVVMPEGEIDIIPFDKHRLTLGASHENDKGFDISFDRTVLDDMESKAQPYFSKWDQAKETRERVGIRAYTSDFSPFFGEVPHLAHVYAASGLGSTGLTIGPLLGQQLAQLVLGEPLLLEKRDYPIEKYIRLQDEG